MEAENKNVRDCGGYACAGQGATLGFAVAFLVLGAAALLQNAGIEVPNDITYPCLFLGLGAAGLWSVWKRGAPR